MDAASSMTRISPCKPHQPQGFLGPDELLRASRNQRRHNGHRVAGRKRVFQTLVKLLLQGLAIFRAARRASPASASIGPDDHRFTSSWAVKLGGWSATTHG